MVGGNRVPTVLVALARRVRNRGSRVPDYFAQHADGLALAPDCRPVDQRTQADVAMFEASASAFALVGGS